jgi:hypothetical protein
MATTGGGLEKWNYFWVLAKEGYFLKNMRDIDSDIENISFSSLVQRPFKIMNAQRSHLEQLIELEEVCWEPHLRIEQKEILYRIDNFPKANWIATVDDSVVGVIYTQRVSSLAIFMNDFTFANHRSFYDPHGSILQLITVAVNGTVKDMQIGQHLRDFMLLQCRLDQSLHDVAAVTRCSSYQSSPKKYADYVSEISDPTLRFHCGGGAAIVNILPNYRPEDAGNLGNGVLIHYMNHHEKQENSLLNMNPKLTVESLHQIVEKISGKKCSLENFLDRPFMTIGLDSLQMQELSYHLRVFSQEKDISPTFLFDRPTPRELLRYFDFDIVPPSPQSSRPIFDRSFPCEYAIVGMSCRFPSSGNTPETYFQMLKDGVDAITPVPLESWGWKLKAEPSNLYCGGILDGSVVESFDESFFGLNSAELESIDPHHRLLLEMSYEALSQAQSDSDHSKDRVTGVYVGLCNTQWNSIVMSEHIRSSSGVSSPAIDPLGPYSGMGVSSASAANRISFHLNLTGPSMVIDTACSSSLVAVDQACNALKQGDCDTAIVASADLILCPYTIEVCLSLYHLFIACRFEKLQKCSQVLDYAEFSMLPLMVMFVGKAVVPLCYDDWQKPKLILLLATVLLFWLLLNQLLSIKMERVPPLLLLTACLNNPYSAMLYVLPKYLQIMSRILKHMVLELLLGIRSSSVPFVMYF